MPSLADVPPSIQAIVTGVLGFVAFGFFLWQIFSRIRVENGQKELNEEQRKDRQELRARVQDLEQQVRTANAQLLEATFTAAEAGSLRARITSLTSDLKDCRTAYKLLELALDNNQRKLELYRLALARTAFFLEGCKGCQNPQSLKSLLEDIPRLLLEHDPNPYKTESPDDYPGFLGPDKAV